MVRKKEATLSIVREDVIETTIYSDHKTDTVTSRVGANQIGHSYLQNAVATLKTEIHRRKREHPTTQGLAEAPKYLRFQPEYSLKPSGFSEPNHLCMSFARHLIYLEFHSPYAGTVLESHSQFLQPECIIVFFDSLVIPQLPCQHGSYWITMHRCTAISPTGLQISCR